MTKFEPLGERVLVRLIERESTTPSGIVLPDNAKGRPQFAEVVAVADDDEMKVREGDTVAFARYSGTEIELDGEKLTILDADDLLGVLQDS